MPVIAITGGLGSGKSTVRKLFEDMGAVGVDTDEIARRVVAPGTEGARRVLEAFGPEFFNDSGELDRKKMASLVFSEDSCRRRLEGILHPLIREEEARVVRAHLRQDARAVVVVEVPLLEEGGRADEYDGVVLVTAPLEKRIERLVASGKYTRSEALSRMAHQSDDALRERLATWRVENAGAIQETRNAVRAVLEEIRPRGQGGPGPAFAKDP